MQKGYFAAAWGDITNSPGWFSKLLLLGLLCLVPIFGAIVVMGYLYGWARDIAWNVHRPMPAHIFGNEDGKLYSRGFFLLVVSIVFALIPAVINGILGFATGMSTGFYGSYSSLHSSLSFGFLGGTIAMLVSFALWLLAAIFTFVGSMRTSVYGTLSSGLQISKIWAMIRYDFTGLLRILGMSLLVGLIIGFIAFVGCMLIVLLGSLFAVALSGSDVIGVIAVFGIFIAFVVFVLFACFASVLLEALVARALGYWTRQFDVHLWGGQDDPMPFERYAPSAPGSPYQSQATAQQQPYYQQPTQAASGQAYQAGTQPAPYQYADQASVPPVSETQPSSVPSGVVEPAAHDASVYEESPAPAAAEAVQSVNQPPVIVEEQAEVATSGDREDTAVAVEAVSETAADERPAPEETSDVVDAEDTDAARSDDASDKADVEEKDDSGESKEKKKKSK